MRITVEGPPLKDFDPNPSVKNTLALLGVPMCSHMVANANMMMLNKFTYYLYVVRFVFAFDSSHVSASFKLSSLLKVKLLIEIFDCYPT